MTKNQQCLLRHIEKRPMKAIITESKLFPSLLSLFPAKGAKYVKASKSVCSETKLEPFVGHQREITRD